MSESRIVGVVIDSKLYKMFLQKLPNNISSTEAITWFVWQIATDEIHIEKEEQMKGEAE